MIVPYIAKEETIMRSSVSPSERLSVTLRFLATGETFHSLSMQYRLGERTVSGIIDETCQALYAGMKDEFLKTPDTINEWIEIAEGFGIKWNYPCCIGAIDGKHVAIQQPPSSGSEFFNYKHFFSVLLLAVVDANYRFIYVDVGAPGRAGDAGVFNSSTLKGAIMNQSLHLPPPALIEGTPAPIHYHFIGDDAFPMSTSMMKPYPQRNLDKEKRIFNYRLSRARRVVENAFGILANRFRVFLTTIHLHPDKVTNLILAACCLHNYLVEKNNHTYANICDNENVDNNSIVAGEWREDPQLIGLPPTSDRNPANNAKMQRDLLKDHFISSLARKHDLNVSRYNSKNYMALKKSLLSLNIMCSV